MAGQMRNKRAPQRRMGWQGLAWGREGGGGGGGGTLTSQCQLGLFLGCVHPAPAWSCVYIHAVSAILSFPHLKKIHNTVVTSIDALFDW